MSTSASKHVQNQLARDEKSLAVEAERFAEKARAYANSVAKDGSQSAGGAFSLAQDAINLLRAASRIGGVQEIAPLVGTTEQ